MRNGPVLLDRYVPDEDATVVEWVLDAGATILGKAVRESLCFSGQPQPHRRLVYGRTAAAGEARDEVHDAAQDPTGPSLARSPSRRTRGAVSAGWPLVEENPKRYAGKRSHPKPWPFFTIRTPG
jgi:Asp-tRNA(Asn)/Glu-tRNA(Gln) amidotransferase A subunit family amidase